MEEPAQLLTLAPVMWGGLECSVKQVQYSTETGIGGCAWISGIVIHSTVQSIAIVSSPAINCGDPGTPTNGQRTLSSTTYNSVVTYTCDVGYALQGSNSRTCQSSGQWSGSLPQCQRMLSIVFWYYRFFGKYVLVHCPFPKLQQLVPVPVKTEGPAQLLTLAPVMWGGLECSVKQVQSMG